MSELSTFFGKGLHRGMLGGSVNMGAWSPGRLQGGRSLGGRLQMGGTPRVNWGRYVTSAQVPRGALLKLGGGLKVGRVKSGSGVSRLSLLVGLGIGGLAGGGK